MSSRAGVWAPVGSEGHVSHMYVIVITRDLPSWQLFCAWSRGLALVHSDVLWMLFFPLSACDWYSLVLPAEGASGPCGAQPGSAQWAAPRTAGAGVAAVTAQALRYAELHYILGEQSHSFLSTLGCWEETPELNRTPLPLCTNAVSNSSSECL